MDNKTTDTTTRLGLLKSRLKVAKAFAKKPHEAMKKWIAEYEISDTSDIDEIRDKVRIGTIFRRTESDLPAIFDDQPDLFMKGRGKYRIFDPYINNVYDWAWDIQDLESKIEDAGLYFILLGMSFVDSPWVTETKEVTELQEQQVPVTDPTTGEPIIDPMSGEPLTDIQQMPVTYNVPIKDQPDALVHDPFKVFFSPETKFSIHMDYDHCPYYLIEHTMTPEHIQAKFGKKVEASETLHTNLTEIDTTIEDLKEYKDDMKRVTVYEYYGVLPEDKAKGVKDKDDKAVKWTYKTDYHVWFTTNEELSIEECPYEEKPMKVLGNYGLLNKFWKFGDAKHLMPLVSELQQYRTQVLRHTRKMANPKPMIPEDANVDEDAFSDPNVGRITKYSPSTTGDKPFYLQPAALGSEVSAGIEMARTDIEQTSGSFNLSQGSGVSQVRTPRGIQTFSEASDRNVRRKRKKIARFIRELIKFQFKECAMYWDPQSPQVAEIIFAGEEQPKATTDDVIQVLGDNNILAKIDIEVESLSVNKVEQKQQALDLWDAAKDRPDIFNVQEIAKDLLQNGFNKKDSDRYLLSTNQQKQMAVQEFIQQLGKANPQLAGALAQFIQQPNLQQMQQPDDTAQFSEPPEQLPPGNGGEVA